MDGLEVAEREAARLVQKAPETFQPDGFAVRIEAARDHGVGLEQAAFNTPCLVARWNADEGMYVCEVGDAVQNLTLFPLPLDPREP